MTLGGSLMQGCDVLWVFAVGTAAAGKPATVIHTFTHNNNNNNNNSICIAP